MNTDFFKKIGKNLVFPLRRANFPQIYADFPADTRRICVKKAYAKFLLAIKYIKSSHPKILIQKQSPRLHAAFFFPFLVGVSNLRCTFAAVGCNACLPRQCVSEIRNPKSEIRNVPVLSNRAKIYYSGKTKILRCLEG